MVPRGRTSGSVQGPSHCIQCFRIQERDKAVILRLPFRALAVGREALFDGKIILKASLMSSHSKDVHRTLVTPKLAELACAGMQPI